jgi:hypothetical protein
MTAQNVATINQMLVVLQSDFAILESDGDVRKASRSRARISYRAGCLAIRKMLQELRMQCPEVGNGTA